MSFAPMLYSPLPLESYVIPSLPTCQVREIKQIEQWPGIWNLFWLSVPTIDTIPGSGTGWWKGYKPTPGVLGAVISDVMLDEPLYRRLISHPRKFADWWYRQDPSIFETYEVLGEGWAETVLQRAHEARDRRATGTEGANVLTFNRKVA